MRLFDVRALALALIAGLAAACAATTTPEPQGADGGRMMAPIPGTIYVLDTYQADPGKLQDVVAFYRDHMSGIYARNGIANIGYWTPIDPADERLFVLTSAPSMEAYSQSMEQLLPELTADDIPLTSLLAGGFYAEPVESAVMQLTDYSPALDLEPPVEPRIFELRIYTTPPGKLDDLHARFADHTLGFFDKHHIGNLLYFELTPGQEHSDDRMVYIVTHPSMEARQTNFFQAFLQDPEWQAVVLQTEADGPLAVQGGIVGVPMQPTDFSPLR